MTTATHHSPPDTCRARAAQALYDAETVLHAARQSHVDAWIAAAEERLHRAVRDYIQGGDSDG